MTITCLIGDAVCRSGLPRWSLPPSCAEAPAANTASATAQVCVATVARRSSPLSRAMPLPPTGQVKGAAMVGLDYDDSVSMRWQSRLHFTRRLRTCAALHCTLPDAQFLGDRGAHDRRGSDFQAFRRLSHPDPRNRCDSRCAEAAGGNVSILPRAAVQLHCRLALLGERYCDRRGIGDREEVARLPRRQHAMRDRDIGVDEPGNVYMGMHVLAPLQGSQS